MNQALTNPFWLLINFRGGLEQLRSVIGVFFLLGLAWAMSNNKKKIDFRLIAWGLGLQLVFALLILKTGPGKAFFLYAENVFHQLMNFSDAGSKFMFGDLLIGMEPADGSKFMITEAGSGEGRSLAQVFTMYGPRFAFKVMPSIIFFASLIGVFYHLGIMQRIVAAMAWVMAKTMRTSGSESLSAACNVFVGQSEAPLLIKPYVSKMTQSELMAVMTGGFATIAGAVMAAFVSFGLDAGHLMSATVMSAPAALVMAKIIFPETEESLTKGAVMLKVEKDTVNVVDAAARGATTGLKLAANVAAMLIAFIALIALINHMLGWAGLSLNQIFGYVFSPIAYFMGVSTEDVFKVGQLLGTKVSINEFVAYLDMTALKGEISARSFTICTYALCGFANFSSIAIQIGGIGSIAPDRKKDLARLGFRAMAGGALASWLTATIAGILI